MVKIRVTNPKLNISKMIDATNYTMEQFKKTVIVYATAGYLVKLIRN